MRSRSERRIDAWTALVAEPAVRAAERAIVTRSPAVLAETLAISAAAESRTRLARVLNLEERAERDPRSREAYQRAADELRSWAAGVYLAAIREPEARSSPPAGRPGAAGSTTIVEGTNPHTEESISLRRSGRRAPFPGQRKRSPFNTGGPAGAGRHVEAAPRRTTADLQFSFDELEESAREARPVGLPAPDRSRGVPGSVWGARPMARDVMPRNPGRSNRQLRREERT